MLGRMRTWRADEWQNVRARGKTNFLIRYGFLGRGLPLGALVAVAIEAALGSPWPDALWGAPFLTRLVALVAVFSASGCVRANFQWNLYEKRYADAGRG
jgi:hypothetical protein